MTEILLCEDTPEKARIARWAIETTSHHLWQHTLSLSDSLAAVEKLTAADSVGAAIIDGNLDGPGTNEDGAAIVQALVRKELNIVTIGYPSVGIIPHARFQTKGDSQKLVEILRQLSQ